MNEFMRGLLFLPEQASTFAERVDVLHFQIFAVTMVTFFVLLIMMLVFYFRFRRREELQVTPVFVPPMVLEVLFIGAPLVLFMTWFFIGFRDFAWLHAPPRDAMDVYVTGKKWMWKFSYPEGPNAIDVLRVPAHRPVRLLLTSRDVIHSFYLPAMRVKQDALPGRYTETWFEATLPGIYPVFCAEYCGLNHSTMIGRVVVMKPEDYDNWLTQERRQTFAVRADEDHVAGEPPMTMVQQGERLALEKGCARCHTVDGTPHLGPTWKNLYRAEVKLINGKTAIADEAYLTRSMMDPLADVVAGYAPMMPSYQGQLASGETAALVEYIKALSIDRPALAGGLP
jgi:cytochrome c oxidase subunit II